MLLSEAGTALMRAPLARCDSHPSCFVQPCLEALEDRLVMSTTLPPVLSHNPLLSQLALYGIKDIVLPAAAERK
jgi:hypothetical protein